MYYQLHEHCKLISGKARSAIYDLQNGKVYSINRSAADLLLRCEKNEFGSIPCAAPVQIHFFDTLTKKGLGGLYLEKPNFSVLEKDPTPKAHLDFAWIELTTKCNNRCLHCYTASTPQEKDEDLLTPERRAALLHEMRSVGCGAVQFIGGEPLLCPEWRALVTKADEEKFEFIELFTNATLLTDEILAFLAAHRVHIATTLYAAHAEIHDRVTQNEGSFQKTMDAIKKILRLGIPLRIASILMKTNEDEGEKIMKLCESLGVEAQPPDLIRPTGRGVDSDLQPTAIRRQSIRPPFYVSKEEFITARHYHPCLAGKIAIAPNGDVFPCVFSRANCLGNVRNTPLTSLLENEKLLTCWKTNKDKITKCKECEYRYACPDCRPYAQAVDATQNWLAASPDCDYDPHTGIWQSDPPPSYDLQKSL